MTEKRRILVDHSTQAGVATKSMTPGDLEALVREVRTRRQAGVDVRCPKPRYRWKPGTEGPCGRKLGELFAFPVGAILEIPAPIEQVLPASTTPPYPTRWRLLAEPSIGRFVEPEVKRGGTPGVLLFERPKLTTTGGSYLIVQTGEGSNLSLDCPRCGVTSDLPKLTRRRVMM